MRGDPGPLFPGARVAAGALLLLLAKTAIAVEEGFFRGPGMAGFVKIQVYEADGDGDGEKETLVRRFRNLAGDRMFGTK